MITVLVPSRGRPELARRLRDTWNRTKRMQTTKIRFYLNDDDPHLNHYKQLINREEYTVGPDQATCFSWNLLAHSAISRGDQYCMLVGDDAQFETEGWDQKIVDFYNNYEKKDKILYVCPRDTTGKENLKWRRLTGKLNVTMTEDFRNRPYKVDKFPSPVGCAHFVLHRNWIQTLGYFLPPQFWHWCIDSWLTKLAIRLGRCYVLPYVTIKSKKLTEDDTGQRLRTRFNISERDNYTWTVTKQRYMLSDQQVLQKFIDDYPTDVKDLPTPASPRLNP